MEESGSHMTAKIWSLTLDIIFMLRGEAPPPVQSGDHVTITVSPPPSCPTLERRTMQKILEAAIKITDLLTGEDPQCDGSDLVTPSDFQKNLHIVIKEEEEEAELLKSGEGSGEIIKMEPCGYTSASDQSDEEAELPRDEDEDVAEAQGVRGYCKEEAFSPEIDSDGRYTARINGDTAANSEGIRFTLNVLGSALTKHSGEKPYPCMECGKCFPKKSTLASHQRAHTGEKPYDCPKCGKSFSRKWNLDLHERVHTGEKPHSCSVCSKSFFSKSYLITHERIHTGEKPYSCSECGKCFFKKTNLIRHEKIHSGVKPYSCSGCEKTFSIKTDLIRHERVHTGEKPFSCLDCGKLFSNKSALVAHVRTHTGEKPYSCHLCEKSFAQRSNLTSHIRVHTVEKPYSCSECGKRFSHKSNLNIHKRLHIG